MLPSRSEPPRHGARRGVRRAVGRSVAVALAVLAAALEPGCHGDTELPTTAPSAPGPASVSASAAAPAGPPPPSGVPKVPHGRLSLRNDGNGLVLWANAAPRLAALVALQAAAGFELSFAEDAALGPPLTVQLDGSSLEEALAVVLGGVPHWLRYGVAADRAETRLLAVHVGDFEPSDLPHPSASAPQRSTARDAEPRLTRGQRLERHERGQAARRRALASPDPMARADAAAWIHVDESTLPLLADALLSDPSAGVRAAAAETLSESMDDRDERLAARSLIQALDDPDPEVVLAALEALESVGAPTDVPDISPLLEHPDERVREQAVDTIEWVQD